MMSEETLIKEYLQLCDIINEAKNIDSKLTKITNWIKEKFKASHVAISQFTEKDDIHYNILRTDKNEKNHEEVISIKKILKTPPPQQIKILSRDELEILNFKIDNPEKRVLYIPALTYDNVLGAIFVIDRNAEGILINHKPLIKLIALKLRDLLITDTEEPSLSLIDSKTKKLKDFLLFTEKLSTPVYITDMEGNFLHINKPFIELTGYSSPFEIKIFGNLFENPEERKREIEIILKTGSITAYHLKLRTKAGEQKDIHDSATLVDNQIWGIFFDITDFVKQRKELFDALEMQEFLNDQIFKTVNLLQKTQVAAIKTLAKLAEFRDRETGNHLMRMSEYASVLAEEVYKRAPYSFKISKEYQKDIYLSSMLHDIGKVGVPDNILLKPGRLTKEEWETMKMHTIWGWEILNEADTELGEQSFLTLASIIALHHHEKYDGTGYPKQLKGENIPLSARITTVGDVYDALTTKRPYKEPWPHEKAVEEFRAQKGKHFDPILVDIFLGIEDKFRKIKEKLSD